MRIEAELLKTFINVGTIGRFPGDSYESLSMTTQQSWLIVAQGRVSHMARTGWNAH